MLKLASIIFLWSKQMAVDSRILAELVDAIKSGDTGSFEKLYNLTIDDYSRYARVYLNSAEDVEDVMQQCYMNLYSYIGTLQNSEHFKTWFSTIVRNECYKKLNISKKQNISFDNYINNESTNNEEIAIQESFDEKSDMYADIHQAVEELSDEQKSCVILYYYENMKASDVAKELGITEAAVKSRLHKSKKVLEKKLEVYRTASVTGISIAISYLLFRGSKETISKSQKAAIWSNVSTAASAKTVAVAEIGAAATTAEVTAAGGTVASAIGTSVAVKSVAVIVATSVAVGGGAAAYKAVKNNTNNQNTTSQVLQYESVTSFNNSEKYYDELSSVSDIQLSEMISSDLNEEILISTENLPESAPNSLSLPVISNSTTNAASSTTVKERTTIRSTSNRYSSSTTRSTRTTNKSGEVANNTENTNQSQSSKTTTKSTTTSRDTTADYNVNSGVLTSYSGKDSSVSIPSTINGNSVTAIGKNAFEGNTSIRSVSLPSGVEQIGQQAFSECTSLSAVSLPSGLETIGLGAFYGCTSLKSVSIPSGTKSIGDNAFASCTSLSSVTIPSSVTSIGDEAFDDCSSSLTIKCSKDSAAYNYAVENGINYQLI